MQTKPFFQTALSLSLALALSACAVHSADQNLTLESTGQVMSAAGDARARPARPPPAQKQVYPSDCRFSDDLQTKG